MNITPRTIASSFKGKRVFITGHTGFKGSWLSLLLHELGATVAGYSLAPNNPSLYDLLTIEPLMEKSYINDINDKKALAEAMHAFCPDVVFHLAAQSLVLPSIQEPVSTFGTNVMGTVNILDVIRTYGKPLSAVIISSDKCYRNVDSSAPYTENDRLGGSDPYTASKACTEIVAAAYRETYFSNGDIRIASARAGNVLGGGDFSLYRLIPDLYRAVKDNNPLILRYPNAIRPWQYILDVLWGYITLAGCLMIGGNSYASEYNFANPNVGIMTVKELVAQILNVWGMDDTIIKIEKAHYPETQTLLINPEKAIKMLGWKSIMDNNAMLQETSLWYQLLLNPNSDIKKYTTTHIRNYLLKVTSHGQ